MAVSNGGMPVWELLIPCLVKVLDVVLCMHICSGGSDHRHSKSVRHTRKYSQQICTLKQTVMLGPGGQANLVKNYKPGDHGRPLIFGHFIVVHKLQQITAQQMEGVLSERSETSGG